MDDDGDICMSEPVAERSAQMGIIGVIEATDTLPWVAEGHVATLIEETTIDRAMRRFMEGAASRQAMHIDDERRD